jgi:hypothetical protein
MAIPSTTLEFAEVLDPHDTLDYVVDATGLLEAGESILSYTITPLAEASALGLTVLNSGGYSNSLISGNKIRFWVNISVGLRGDVAFNGSGASLPLEIAITTTSMPPRTKQRTIAIRVAQR